jgi:uncharacterized protein YcgI (DUF1989 family)
MGGGGLMGGVSVHVAPQTGEFVEARAGQLIRVTDIDGHQVGDFFAARSGSPGDWLSVAQTRNFTERLAPRPGDRLYSATGDPIMEFVEDHSPGFHDTLYPPCDDAYYVSEGLHGHPNCRDNFLAAAQRAGLSAACVPNPLNLFQDSLPDRDNEWSIEVKVAMSEAGDYVVFRALEDLVVVLTACSVDNYVTNNFLCTPLQLDVYS